MVQSGFEKFVKNMFLNCCQRIGCNVSQEFFHDFGLQFDMKFWSKVLFQKVFFSKFQPKLLS